MPALRSRGLCGGIRLHNCMVFNRFNLGLMTDNDKHIVVTAAMSFVVGLLCAVALRLQGVSGVDCYCGVFSAGFLGGLAAGVGKEYGDECAEGNQWDWEDIFADAIGSLVGSGFAMILTILI